jgi:methionine--tRNA ligase beta chain
MTEEAATNQKSVIEYVDFEKLDIRVGLITEVIAPDWSKKLLQLTVDFGPEIGERTILSGIKAWYEPQDIQGKKAQFVVNLAERKMGPGTSQGMMLMADQEEKPILVFVPDEVEIGVVIR